MRRSPRYQTIRLYDGRLGPPIIKPTIITFVVKQFGMRSRHVFVQRRFRVESLFALGALKALAAIPDFVTLQMALQLTSIRLIKLPYLYHQVDRDKNELRHFAKFSSLTSPVVLVAAYFALEFSFFVTFDRRFG